MQTILLYNLHTPPTTPRTSRRVRTSSEMAETIQEEITSSAITNENYETDGSLHSNKSDKNSDEDQNIKSSYVKGGSMANSRIDLHSTRTASPSGIGSNYMKDVIASLHRSTMASAMSSIAIRDAALVSLVHIVESENIENSCDNNSSHAGSAASCQYSLIVLQVFIVISFLNFPDIFKLSSTHQPLK